MAIVSKKAPPDIREAGHLTTVDDYRIGFDASGV